MSLNSYLVYHFWPHSTINPFVSIGVGYQWYEVEATDGFTLLRAKSNTEIFRIQTGAEITFSDTFSVQAYASTLEAFESTDFSALVTDNVSFHVDSTWKYGETFYTGLGLFSDFDNTDIAMSFLIGKTF